MAMSDSSPLNWLMVLKRISFFRSADPSGSISKPPISGKLPKGEAETGTLLRITIEEGARPFNRDDFVEELSDVPPHLLGRAERRLLRLEAADVHGKGGAAEAGLPDREVVDLLGVSEILPEMEDEVPEAPARDELDDGEFRRVEEDGLIVVVEDVDDPVLPALEEIGDAVAPVFFEVLGFVYDDGVELGLERVFLEHVEEGLGQPFGIEVVVSPEGKEVPQDREEGIAQEAVLPIAVEEILREGTVLEGSESPQEKLNRDGIEFEVVLVPRTGPSHHLADETAEFPARLGSALRSQDEIREHEEREGVEAVDPDVLEVAEALPDVAFEVVAEAEEEDLLPLFRETDSLLHGEPGLAGPGGPLEADAVLIVENVQEIILEMVDVLEFLPLLVKREEDGPGELHVHVEEREKTVRLLGLEDFAHLLRPGVAEKRLDPFSDVPDVPGVENVVLVEVPMMEIRGEGGFGETDGPSEDAGEVLVEAGVIKIPEGPLSVAGLLDGILDAVSLAPAVEGVPDVVRELDPAALHLQGDETVVLREDDEIAFAPDVAVSRPGHRMKNMEGIVQLPTKFFVDEYLRFRFRILQFEDLGMKNRHSHLRPER